MAGESGAGPGGEDEETWLLSARSDPDAFVQFYDLRYPKVAAFFYRRTLCAFTTAELTAETFARLWATRGRFDPDKGSAMGWTMGIASNLYRQWTQSETVADTMRTRLSIETPPLVLEDLERVEDLVDLSAMRRQLHGALDRMSPKLKEAILLRVALDLPYEEVADRIGCSIGAARVRVSRGLDVLLAGMEEQLL